MSAPDEERTSVSARSGASEASHASASASRASESAREMPSRSSLSRAPSTSSVMSFASGGTSVASRAVAFAPSTTGGGGGGDQSAPSTARSARAAVDATKGYFKPTEDGPDGSATTAAATAAAQQHNDNDSGAGGSGAATVATPARSSAAHQSKRSTPKTGTKSSPQRKASLSGPGASVQAAATSTPTKRTASASRNARPNTASPSPLRASASSSALLAPHHQQQQSPAGPSPSSSPAATWSFEFPRGQQASPARKQGASGVFKAYFTSPTHAHSNPAYQVYAAASTGAEPPDAATILGAEAQVQSPSQSPVLLSPAPMSEFPLSPFSRPKQLDTQARKASAARRELALQMAHQAGGAGAAAGRATSPVRPGTAELRGSNTNGAHSRTLGHSASAAALSTGADGYDHNNSGGDAGSSFARRMIHAQSAAELLSHPPHPEPLSDDPDASSLFFQGRPARSSEHESATNALAEEGEEEEEEWRVEQQQLVPYGATPSNSYATVGGAAQRRAHQLQQQRPNTAGVSSTGIAWSSRLTATLSGAAAAGARGGGGSRPLTSSSSGRRLPAATTAAPALPPELTVGVEAMPAHMQRDHAALAKLIARLEPAGRGSLAGASASFSKLSTAAARDSLFSGALRRQSPEPSQTQRLEMSSSSDELLRRRSIQKGIENQRQSSASLASRGASGLAANNLNGRAVADAVRNTNAEYPISDERPRNARPATAAPFLGVAAALAAAGSPAATDLIGAVTSPQKKLLMRPGTAARPSTSSGTSSRSRSSGGDSAPLLLLPGMGGPAVGGAAPVLGFGGSIDRFASSVEELRFVGSAQSATGGRGLMGSRSAHKILGGLIPTGADAAAGSAATSSAADAAVMGGVPSSSKRFSSLALEFEVSLQERLVRIDGRSATAPLERLDVARTLFDDIILHSPIFGGLLSKVKAEYEAYARGGGDAYARSAAATAAGSSRAPLSGSSLTAQQVEDTLVLENHRLNAKLHGFQRAYTSLYAKYKSLLHTQKVQEGILAQNALVLADLNAQLQAAVLASMADEERNMDALRRAGFKLDNETEEDAREAAARRLRKQQAAILPDLLAEDDDEEDEGPAEAAPPGEHPASEAGRRRAHARKVARARRAAEALARAQADPLERGRQLMRQFQRPPGYVPPGVGDDAGGEEDDEANAEGAPLSPTKLSSFLEAGLAPVHARGGAGGGDPNDPASMVGGSSSASDPSVALETDPLDYAASHGRRALEQERAEKALLEQRLLRMETLLEQARAKELHALMAMEEFSKQRYMADKQAKEEAAVAAASSSAGASVSTASGAGAPSRPMLDNISVPGRDRTGSATSGNPGGSSSGSTPVPIPALPIKDLVAELEQRERAQRQQTQSQSQQHGGRHGLNGPSGSADASPSYDDEDEDPDTALVGDGDDGDGDGRSASTLSEKDRTLAELRFERQMVDSRLELMGVSTAADTAPDVTAAAASPTGSSSPVPPLPLQSAAARSASAEADATLQLEMASQLSRKTTRSAYTLTGPVEEDDWFD